MKRLELAEVQTLAEERISEIDGRTLAEIVEGYVDPDLLYDDEDDCFYKPETEADETRSVAIFQLLDDGQDCTLYLGSLSLPPAKSINDIQSLYEEWNKGDRESNFPVWLIDNYGFVFAKETEGFVFVQAE